MMHSQATLGKSGPNSSDIPWNISTPSSDGSLLTPNTNAGLPSSSIPDQISIYAIPEAVTEEQLDQFRYSFLPLFPFVHIPITTSARELRSRNPFLWLVIMSLTTKVATQQIAMGHTIRQIISGNLVAENEKSIDILLGLICYLGWYVILLAVVS
jgi:hypothetical protein